MTGSFPMLRCVVGLVLILSVASVLLGGFVAVAAFHAVTQQAEQDLAARLLDSPDGEIVVILFILVIALSLSTAFIAAAYLQTRRFSNVRRST
jgi:hypothetical protein